MAFGSSVRAPAAVAACAAIRGPSRAVRWRVCGSPSAARPPRPLRRSVAQPVRLRLRRPEPPPPPPTHPPRVLCPVRNTDIDPPTVLTRSWLDQRMMWAWHGLNGAWHALPSKAPRVGGEGGAGATPAPATKHARAAPAHLIPLPLVVVVAAAAAFAAVQPGAKLSLAQAAGGQGAGAGKTSGPPVSSVRIARRPQKREACFGGVLRNYLPALLSIR